MEDLHPGVKIWIHKGPKWPSLRTGKESKQHSTVFTCASQRPFEKIQLAIQSNSYQTPSSSFF